MGLNNIKRELITLAGETMLLYLEKKLGLLDWFYPLPYVKGLHMNQINEEEMRVGTKEVTHSRIF